MMDRVMFTQAQRDLAYSGFRGHLLKAAALKFVGDERMALPFVECLQSSVQFFKQGASRVARLRSGMPRGKRIFDFQPFPVLSVARRKVRKVLGLLLAKDVDDSIPGHAV